MRTEMKDMSRVFILLKKNQGLDDLESLLKYTHYVYDQFCEKKKILYIHLRKAKAKQKTKIQFVECFYYLLSIVYMQNPEARLSKLAYTKLLLDYFECIYSLNRKVFQQSSSIIKYLSGSWALDSFQSQCSADYGSMKRYVELALKVKKKKHIINEEGKNYEIDFNKVMKKSVSGLDEFKFDL